MISKFALRGLREQKCSRREVRSGHHIKVVPWKGNCREAKLQKRNDTAFTSAMKHAWSAKSERFDETAVSTGARL